MMSERRIRSALVVVNLFAALSAFAGAVGLVVGYMQIPLGVLDTTPFTDFTFPALLLGVVVGGSALAAALVALFGPRTLTLFGQWRFDAAVSAVAGCIMVGWMIIEVAMIGPGIWVQAAYFVVGLVMIGLAVLLQWAESRPVSRRPSVTSRHHLA